MERTPIKCGEEADAQDWREGQQLRVSTLSNRHPTNVDQVMQLVEPSGQFVKDSIRLVKRCTKPDRKDFRKITTATAIGFAIIFVRLIRIPINNTIVGG
ncbi:protein transport protein Sec61 subunit gamma-like [Rattus rattus]|uniref:protein transport protein Sec61 subunit gamma-like n=1 Tax=Rattus rattus TaxID=10117 RepID=UPI0013F2D887|nr:protein transport protein Sec61 subunit gamma-like [Rattus rattus]